MSTLTTLTNHQVRLASRPVGLPTRANWSFTTEPVAEPGPGGVLVKTLYLSLDPAMRGWMNEGKSYIRPVALGEVMRAGTLGEVVTSKTPAFKPGEEPDDAYSVIGFTDSASSGGMGDGDPAEDSYYQPQPRQNPGLGSGGGLW